MANVLIRCINHTNQILHVRSNSHFISLRKITGIFFSPYKRYLWTVAKMYLRSLVWMTGLSINMTHIHNYECIYLFPPQKFLVFSDGNTSAILKHAAQHQAWNIRCAWFDGHVIFFASQRGSHIRHTALFIYELWWVYLPRVIFRFHCCARNSLAAWLDVNVPVSRDIIILDSCRCCWHVSFYAMPWHRISERLPVVAADYDYLAKCTSWYLIRVISQYAFGRSFLSFAALNEPLN